MTAPKLKNKKLFTTHCRIGAKWCTAGRGNTIAVYNPSTGKLLGTVPDMGKKEAKQAIDAAHKALPEWRALTAKERSALLYRWYELIIAHQDDLAIIMTAEQGKPLAEAKGEIAYGASFIQWFAEEAKRAYGAVVPSHLPDSRIVVTKEPVGVCAAITPWNFPCAMITRKVGPALAAGCTMVLKPAGQTPYSALALAVLAQEAGIPAGVFNVITGDAKAIGAVLTSSPIVRKLSFTGSTPTGKLLMRQCSDTIKKLSLELGGNAPFIVFNSADIDAAVKGALASKYRNSGQTCVCANRFLVQKGIYDEFIAALSKAVKRLKVGDGFAPGIQQGPLIDDDAIEKVETLVADAIKQGATIVLGGKRHRLGGRFYEPTIITEVKNSMRLAQEEIFGPVASVLKFSSEEEVIRIANNTPYGLASYIYTNDLGQAWRVSAALECGMVAINQGLLSTELAPFGGIKESGLGREGSFMGLEEYLETKYTLMGW